MRGVNGALSGLDFMVELDLHFDGLASPVRAHVYIVRGLVPQLVVGIDLVRQLGGTLITTTTGKAEKFVVSHGGARHDLPVLDEEGADRFWANVKGGGGGEGGGGGGRGGGGGGGRATALAMGRNSTRAGATARAELALVAGAANITTSGLCAR